MSRITQAEETLRDAKESLAWAKRNLALVKKQEKCKHKRVDKPGSYFGETCLDCKLYLNNGA